MSTAPPAPDPKATAVTRARYDRIAAIYDWMEALVEIRYRHWREDLWAQVPRGRLLEVGVGTGKNIPYYPSGAQVFAVDISPRMLRRARRRARQLGQTVHLIQADGQRLPFPPATFDAVVATFVYCSIPNPVLGLQEVLRVLKPGGRVYLLEHMRADASWVGWLMDVFNPVVVRLVGANINRPTLENLRRAGFDLRQVEPLTWQGIFKRIVAEPQTQTATSSPPIPNQGGGDGQGKDQG